MTSNEGSTRFGQIGGLIFTFLVCFLHVNNEGDLWIFVGDIADKKILSFYQLRVNQENRSHPQPFS